MHGETAQIAALACHCNARRRGIATGRFFPENSTCQSCEWIHFLRPISGSDAWKVIARSPDEWIDLLLAENVTRVLLLEKSVNDLKNAETMKAGPVNRRVSWVLYVQYPGRSECWHPGKTIGNRNAPDHRIWRVQYATVDVTRIIFDSPNLATLANEFADVLIEIEQFARTQKLDAFAKLFAKAQQCLSCDGPIPVVYPLDVAPPGVLPPEAARLLAACHAAWVFSGMGSWSDLTFYGEKGEQYSRLSGHLFKLLHRAICASVNSSAP